MAASTMDQVDKVTVAMSSASLEGEGEGKKRDRHCAFCLTLVKGAEVQLCGKCKRRAYCSKECQTADWKSPKKDPAFTGTIYGYGQGHKEWCGLPYGEEDLDWKVTPIKGKGLGIVALRDLPPLYRIIVDGLQLFPAEGKRYHPGVNDLEPLSDTDTDTTDISGKWRLNMCCSLNLGEEKEESRSMTSSSYSSNDNTLALGLRIARVNHSCQSNAAILALDQHFRVAVLFSDRGIKAGEEICSAYVSWCDLGVYGTWSRLNYFTSTTSMLSYLYRKALELNWGVLCPPTCFCYKADLKDRIIPLMTTCVNLMEEIEAAKGLFETLPLMERIVALYEREIRAPPSVLQTIYMMARDCAIRDLNYGTAKDKAMASDKTRLYLEVRMEILGNIYHPKDPVFVTLDNERRAKMIEASMRSQIALKVKSDMAAKMRLEIEQMKSEKAAAREREDACNNSAQASDQETSNKTKEKKKSKKKEKQS